MTDPTTLRFRAENFEAVATRVTNGDSADGGNAWVVTAPGHAPCTLMLLFVGGLATHEMFAWSPEHGWLRIGRDTEGHRSALALAISVQYSVPGVEVVT